MEMFFLPTITIRKNSFYVWLPSNNQKLIFCFAFVWFFGSTLDIAGFYGFRLYLL